ncbi:LLM class flavin-dependent oxidoreductase [Arthrobacter sp. VKM Ac-2550]|uniref:LLM class flavin-dependent oxidoreductase n=1 Tax=Crystallibacter permensis TaxID=1938888 RepID=UPI002225EAF3|nr:LLM class flavin-dependent oxidoreductase [Arthrobacter sp. VKM Ac-2550]MCW2134558.1 FMN-dependent oxidoreductase, nitrilotriacetate monooxygenase family [Arthrobacter sp. VKM Ac-2550]
MAQRISLNAFDMTTPTHQSPGLWRHPENRAHTYNTLEYWTDLAQTLERGTFDALFLADVLGIYDVYKNSSAPALLDADQVPLNDPFMQISAMATVTKNLGFAVTSALTYEQPYALARKFSSLDHLTRGRIGWNVVTSYLESAARNLGMTRQLGHDDRYDLAEEFMDVVYKLWEGSWEEGAVVLDRERGVYTDPSKVHPINHHGEYFDVPGIHLSEPSLQRTPAIFQAGASPRGRAFGAKHAEGIFLNSIRPEITRKATDATRDAFEAAGRPRNAGKFYALVTAVVADSDAEAEKLHREYQSYSSREGAMTFYGGWSGLDLSRYAGEEELKYLDTNAARSALSIFTTADPERSWTPNSVADYLGVGGIGPVLVGSPETVADEIERWVDVAGLDGINLAYAITPGSFEQFVDLVVPELRKRGRVWEDYEGSTLREYLDGPGNARVAHNHPAAAYRGAYAGSPSAADSAATSTPEAILGAR